MNHKIGDIIHLTGSGKFKDGIDCMVVELAADDGRIVKIKALEPDPELAKHGFYEEGGDYVSVEWHWSPN